MLNGGRLYLDMGHIEFSTPECVGVRDLVAVDRAGDHLLQQALDEMGVADRVSFLKNNIDHHVITSYSIHYTKLYD